MRFEDLAVLDEVDFVGSAQADAERSREAAMEVLARYYVTLREKQRVSRVDGFDWTLPEVAILADLGERVVVRREARGTTLAVVQMPAETPHAWALRRWANGPDD